MEFCHVAELINMPWPYGLNIMKSMKVIGSLNRTFVETKDLISQKNKKNSEEVLDCCNT